MYRCMYMYMEYGLCIWNTKKCGDVRRKLSRATLACQVGMISLPGATKDSKKGWRFEDL